MEAVQKHLQPCPQEYRRREHKGCSLRRVRPSAVPKQPGGTGAAGLGPRRPSPDFRMGSVAGAAAGGAGRAASAAAAAGGVVARHLLGLCPPRLPLGMCTVPQLAGPCGSKVSSGASGLGGLSCSLPGDSKPQGPGGSGEWRSSILPSLLRCDGRIPSSLSPLNRGLRMPWGDRGKVWQQRTHLLSSSHGTKDRHRQDRKPPVLSRLPDVFLTALQPLVLGAGWGVVTRGAAGPCC